MHPSSHSAIFWLPVLALALVACDRHESLRPTHDDLTVQLIPGALSVADLTVTTATLTIANLKVFGDNANAVGGNNDTVMLALPSAGVVETLGRLPPGFYSRAQLDVENLALTGFWRALPLTIDVGMFGGGMVTLRSAAGQNVSDDVTASFVITIDPNQWFSGAILDTATVANGAIFCDGVSNQDLGGALVGRIAASFSID